MNRVALQRRDQRMAICKDLAWCRLWHCSIEILYGFGAYGEGGWIYPYVGVLWAIALRLIEVD